MKRNHKYYVEMSLFAVSQKLSSREDTDAKSVHTLPPEHTLAQLHQELFQDLLQLELRSQAFSSKTVQPSFLPVLEGRSVHFYIITLFRDHFWFVGSGKEQEGKLCLAFNRFLSCHYLQKRKHRWT